MEPKSSVEIFPSVEAVVKHCTARQACVSTFGTMPTVEQVAGGVKVVVSGPRIGLSELLEAILRPPRA
jgi:hypothetical protein